MLEVRTECDSEFQWLGAAQWYLEALQGSMLFHYIEKHYVVSNFGLWNKYLLPYNFYTAFILFVLSLG